MRIIYQLSCPHCTHGRIDTHDRFEVVCEQCGEQYRTPGYRLRQAMALFSGLVFVFYLAIVLLLVHLVLACLWELANRVLT